MSGIVRTIDSAGQFSRRCRAALVAIAGTGLFLVSSQAAPRLVFLVSGQSNVLNWHADAKLLSPDSRDASVPFYFLTGAPPSSRNVNPPFNSTSGGAWTKLAPQVQEPYVKYEREFFGPEISAARTILDGQKSNVAFIKVAFFGTNLADQWNPDASSGDQLYAIMRREVSSAFRLLKEQGDDPIFAGVFWMQGETDAKSQAEAGAYEANLKAFVARIRKDFQSPNLPFIVARIGPDAKNPNQDVVRAAQVRVAVQTPHMAWVDTDDLERYSDNIHLLAPGVIAVGERFAKAWLGEK